VLRSYSLSELEGLKLILPSGIHELRLIIDTVCKRRGILLRPELELDSLEAVMAMLTKRPLRYFTILPSHGVQSQVESWQISQFAIDDPDMFRTISIVTPVKTRNEAITAYLHRRLCEQASIVKSRLATVF
jgi:DNA-binding transcriptional LysR family regulator